jgi:hypothetical protein
VWIVLSHVWGSDPQALRVYPEGRVYPQGMACTGLLRELCRRTKFVLSVVRAITDGGCLQLVLSDGVVTLTRGGRRHVSSVCQEWQYVTPSFRFSRMK